MTALVSGPVFDLRPLFVVLVACVVIGAILKRSRR